MLTSRRKTRAGEMKEYDFIVIGSGIAGLTFALKAATHGSVAVVTKRKGADSNTAWRKVELLA